MQRIFAEGTPWHTPWMPRVLPVVRRIVEAHPDKTVFTRFMPPIDPEAAHGSWRRYYDRWRDLTLERREIGNKLKQTRSGAVWSLQPRFAIS